MNLLRILACLFVLVASTKPAHAQSGNPVPLGDEALGITLNGHLAGRTVYFLDASFNLPDCWLDSVYWTGRDLYYAISSIRFPG